MKKLIIIGVGGAGLEALLVARRMGVWKILGFADDSPALESHEIEGLPVLGSTQSVLLRFQSQAVSFHCAIGRNAVRLGIADLIERAGFDAAALVDPSTVIAPTATVGRGSYLAPQAFVGPYASIGRHVLLNVGASVGHHAVCADFAQASPGVRMSGHSKLGIGAFAGSNAVLAPGVKVGDWATVGAASLAVRDVPERTTALGVPAKILAAPAPTS